MKKFKFTYQKRSKVLQIANALVKQGWKFGEAQKMGWEVVRFMDAISRNEVVLRFYKDGDDIPQQRVVTAINSKNYTYKGGKAKKENPLQVRFMDLHKNQPRSFNVSRFDSFKLAA